MLLLGKLHVDWAKHGRWSLFVDLSTIGSYKKLVQQNLTTNVQ